MTFRDYVLSQGLPWNEGQSISSPPTPATQAYSDKIIQNKKKIDQIMKICDKCESLTPGSYHCTTIAGNCGCGGGSVVQRIIDGGSCPKNKWSFVKGENAGF